MWQVNLDDYDIKDKIIEEEANNVLQDVYDFTECKTKDDVVEQIVENMHYDWYIFYNTDIWIGANLEYLIDCYIENETIGKSIKSGKWWEIIYMIMSCVDYEAITEMVENNREVQKYLKDKYNIDLVEYEKVA